MSSFRVVNTANFAPQPRVVAAAGGAGVASSVSGRAALHALAELLDRGVGDALASGALGVEDFFGALQDAAAGGDANAATILGGMVHGDGADAFGDLLSGNTNSRYKGSTAQRGQAIDLFDASDSAAVGAAGLPSRLDLAAERPLGLRDFGPNIWRQAFPPSEPRSNEPDEAPKPIITDDGLDIYGPQNPAPSARENIPKLPLKQPGPDGGGAGYAALAAWLLSRISGLPIARWGAQFPSSVGPRVNPGRDPASQRGGGPKIPLPDLDLGAGPSRVRQGAYRGPAQTREGLQRQIWGGHGPRPIDPRAASLLANLVAKLV